MNAPHPLLHPLGVEPATGPEPAADLPVAVIGGGLAGLSVRGVTVGDQLAAL